MIFNAYSREEALALAREYFQCDESLLDVKEIRAPSNNIIKLLRKKGVYEISLKEQEAEEQPEEKEDTDGRVGVSNGQIVVTDPGQGGVYPMVVLQSRVAELYVNGEKIEKETVLKSKDKIEIKFYNEEPAAKIKVWLSEDKLKAYMKILKVPGKEYYIRDASPVKRLVLQVDYRETEPDPPKMEECLEELRAAGVDPRFIKYDNIKSLLEGRESEVVAAEGEPPVHGVDSKIDYYFQTESYRNPDFDTDKRVNLLDHTIIPHVKAGDVLAVKTRQATSGIDGVAVTGAVLKAKNGIDLPLKAGNGAAVEDNKIIAMINGRPNLKYGVVSVVPTLVVTSNVCVETGNINFDGDVDIRGHVEENLSVRATGSIKISGNVYHATIQSGGNIEIKGHVINSRITAGTNMAKYMCINPWLKQVLGVVKAIRDSVSELKGSQAYVNVKYHVRQMIVQYKPQMDLILSELDNKKRFFDKTELDELEALIKLIKQTLTGVNAKFIEDVELLETLREEVEKYIWTTDKNILNEGNLVVNYIQNSMVQANGNVTVLEKGSFHSDIIARDSIIFTNPRSIVRGGYLLAGNRIKMNTVGTPSGATTYCKVLNREGTIEADSFTNVFLDIGGNIKTIE